MTSPYTEALPTALQYLQLWYSRSFVCRLSECPIIYRTVY